jgi:dihydroflavonol-4-reductase
VEKLYIVTGAFGHLGNTVVKKLLAQGKKVRCLALPNDKTRALPGAEFELFRGDIRDKASLAPLFKTGVPCEKVVIHTAGIVTLATRHMQNVYDVNVAGTKNIIELCHENNIARLVYVSSARVLPELPGQPVITEVDSIDPAVAKGLYVKTKAMATQAVLASAAQGLDAVVVHPSVITGPNDYGNGHLTGLVLDYLNGGLKLCVRGGYDFVDVRDVAKGILLAAEHGRRGQCYILSNRFFPVIEVLDLLHEISGKKKIKTVLPLWFVQASAPLAETYFKLRRHSPLYTSYSLYSFFNNANFSNAKAVRELGYSTRDMKVTLKDTVVFLREHRRLMYT